MPVTFQLTLTDVERAELVKILEQSLSDIHVESRRTEAPEYRNQIHQEESVIRSLVEKLHRLGSV